MKIKEDFVTNSSSSSFVVMGIDFDIHSLSEEITNNIIHRISANDNDSESKVSSDNIREELDEYMDVLLKGTDLIYSTGYDYYNDDIIVGISYTQMKDDETFKEFKQRVHDQILEVFGIDKTPGHIQECWMDN